MLGAQVARGRPIQPTASGMKRLVRQAELKSGTGATGFTLLKMASKPIARLIETRQIGPEELQAATDISVAFTALTGALWVKPQSMEKQDKGHGGNEPAALVDAQVRYRHWAQHWSMLAKRGDKTLEIIIAAVIDERGFDVIEGDIGLRHGTAKKAVIRGLRDYAVRAGWVRGRLGEQWKAEAGMTFKAWHPNLIAAVARAVVLKQADSE